RLLVVNFPQGVIGQTHIADGTPVTLCSEQSTAKDDVGEKVSGQTMVVPSVHSGADPAAIIQFCDFPGRLTPIQ
ncbi:hypothetical protein, partial [Klebsiella pneumoniae]|uniref:hypothetical protein n=1 Tax=Klebsiella pneumoniae TaxID=573 RepID=UPI00210A8E85